MNNSKTNFIIDKMTNEDLENIKDILTTEFDDFWNYNVLKQELLNENSCYFVAKDTSGIIQGFAGVQFVLDETNIMNIVTKKSYRNQGIGSLLLEKLIAFSKENNMRLITLEVNENNSSALALYNKFGFKTMGVRKNYYNGTDNAVIMTLFF